MIATSNIKAAAFGLAVVALLPCLPESGHADTGSVPNTGIATQSQTGNNPIVDNFVLRNPAEWSLTFRSGDDAQAFLTIHPDGRVDIPKGVTYTHAARCFWNAVSAEGLHGPVFPKERCSK